MADLPSDVVAWIESTVDAKVTSSRQIPAGGRQGFFVDVRGSDGAARELFLQIGRSALASGPSLFHGFALEAEVLRALEPFGVAVPHVHGVDAAADLLLVNRLPGAVWFQPPREESEQVAVAKDFIVNLARWHRVPAQDLALPSFGPVKSLHEHQADQLDGIAKLFADTAPAADIDPLVAYCLDWLRSNIPDVNAPVVLVQGDTGPGNFLYADGKVTGIVDWELAHLGDPMDDIAWLSWRATQHGFPDFPARMREYEELTGIAVDDARVNYYRLNAFGRLGPHFGMPDMGGGSRRVGPPTVDAASDRTADGSWTILSMLHRRMRLEATAAALGTPVPPRGVDAEAPPIGHEKLYDRVLDQVQSMVGRIEDRTTASMGKAVARQIKYIKELDRNGDFFAAAEFDDLAALLGARPDALADGRRALVDRVRNGGVGMDDYLDYHWRRLRRDDHLMRVASGVLFDRSWPPLR